MKTIVLIRHAKSEQNIAVDDFDRPLHKHGENDATAMGKRLLQLALALPDVMVASAAKRTQTTCMLMAEQLKFDPHQIIYDSSLYHAHPSHILKIIQSLADSFSVVYLVGHNPGITALAHSLSNTLIDSMPTCSVVISTHHVQHWKDVRINSGQFVRYEKP